MKILSTNSEHQFSATINCECGTLFEFEASDMIVKGNYAKTYHVTCPTCKTDYDFTDKMNDDNQEEVDKYIDSCRSCSECKYMALIKQGYSSYTVTDISIDCKMNENQHMPLSGYEDRHEKESVYAFAEKCPSFKNGVRYVKEVEEPENEAFKRWEKENNNYSDY